MFVKKTWSIINQLLRFISIFFVCLLKNNYIRKIIKENSVQKIINIIPIGLGIYYYDKLSILSQIYEEILVVSDVSVFILPITFVYGPALFFRCRLMWSPLNSYLGKYEDPFVIPNCLTSFPSHFPVVCTDMLIVLAW